MRKPFLIGSLLFGLCSAGAAIALEPARPAQSEPAMGSQRQRAPGVPLAPSPGIVEQREGALAGAGGNIGSRPRSVRQARSGPQVERDPPMPRGVPSIIAP